MMQCTNKRAVTNETHGETPNTWKASEAPVLGRHNRQDLKEHLAAEKQIAAARVDEVAMAAIRADPQILEEHLAVGATVDALRANTATRLAALNNSSWRFLEATLGAFNTMRCFLSVHVLTSTREPAGWWPERLRQLTTTTRAPTMRRPHPLSCPRSQSSSISPTMRSSLSY